MTDHTSKIDARLLAEMERLQRARQAGQVLAVVIEPAAAKTDEKAVQTAREHIRKSLERMGAKDVKDLGLTSAVVARLTPEQIRKVAAESAVKRIFWDAPEKVTIA